MPEVGAGGAAARWMTSYDGPPGWRRRSGSPITLVNQGRPVLRRIVVRPFVRGVLCSGRTPIPCSLCNNHLKFDQLLNCGATDWWLMRWRPGHYARSGVLTRAGGRWLLKRPADHSKDQTYFLFGLTQEQLSRTLFPLGGMIEASSTWSWPDSTGLALAQESRNSQEICFVPGGGLQEVSGCLPRRTGRKALPDTAGELVTTTGRGPRGTRRDPQTLPSGQRKGLGL